MLGLEPELWGEGPYLQSSMWDRWLGLHLDHWIFLLRKDSFSYIFTFFNFSFTIYFYPRLSSWLGIYQPMMSLLLWGKHTVLYKDPVGDWAQEFQGHVAGVDYWPNLSLAVQPQTNCTFPVPQCPHLQSGTAITFTSYRCFKGQMSKHIWIISNAYNWTQCIGKS